MGEVSNRDRLYPLKHASSCRKELRKVWRKLFGFREGDEVSFYDFLRGVWKQGVIVTKVLDECNPPRYWVKPNDSTVILSFLEDELE